MAYSDFKSLSQTVKDLSLRLENHSRLFSTTQPLEPSERLKALLADHLELAANIGTEKARSELIVAPILLDVRRHLKNQISYFSGSTLNVDAEKGLTGECDFVLSGSVNQLEISVPVLTVVEAKKSDIKLGLGQCAAQMVGAQYFKPFTRAGSDCLWCCYYRRDLEVHVPGRRTAVSRSLRVLHYAAT
jgi:hypothetical protein